MARPDAIDVHAHFFPERYLDLIAREGAPQQARINRSDPKGPSIVLKDSRTLPLEATYWDLDRRRKVMDRVGVAVHALSLTSPMVYWADGDLVLRLAAAVNDGSDSSRPLMFVPR